MEELQITTPLQQYHKLEYEKCVAAVCGGNNTMPSVTLQMKPSESKYHDTL